MSFKERIRRFFNPPSGSPRWMFILPYTVLAILVIGLLIRRGLWLGIYELASILWHNLPYHASAKRDL